MSVVVSGVDIYFCVFCGTFVIFREKEKSLQIVDLQGFKRRRRDLNSRYDSLVLLP